MAETASGSMSKVLRVVLEEMGVDQSDPRMALARMQQERDAAISALRGLCSDYGDNDWPDSLNLYDIIEKHLARHLRMAEVDRRAAADERDH